MNKHQAHHYYRLTRHFRWQYLLLAAGIAGVVCLLALRHNSEVMATKRDAVFAADRDNGDVKTALKDLQSYVTAHMNTSLTAESGNIYPPIQLKFTYQRLVEQQGAALTQQNANGNKLYTEAQAYCQAQNPTDFSGRNRIPCIEKYVQERGTKVTLAQPIPDSLYKFDFLSPRWSPDVAGWSMVVAAALFITAIAKLIADWLMRRHR